MHTTAGSERVFYVDRIQHLRQNILQVFYLVFKGIFFYFGAAFPLFSLRAYTIGEKISCYYKGIFFQEKGPIRHEKNLFRICYRPKICT
jgi:hypothetical protein